MRNSDIPTGAAPAVLPPAPETQNAPESEVHARPSTTFSRGWTPTGGPASATSRRMDRLGLYGRNELTAEAPVPAWRKFLAQFSDVLVILLLVAGLVSAGLWLFERDAALPYEAIAIFAIVLLNAVMGYVQEARAEQAVAALRQMSAAQAHGDARRRAAERPGGGARARRHHPHRGRRHDSRRRAADRGRRRCRPPRRR